MLWMPQYTTAKTFLLIYSLMTAIAGHLQPCQGGKLAVPLQGNQQTTSRSEFQQHQRTGNKPPTMDQAAAPLADDHSLSGPGMSTVCHTPKSSTVHTVNWPQNSTCTFQRRCLAGESHQSGKYQPQELPTYSSE
jgi:hypothetical protein